MIVNNGQIDAFVGLAILAAVLLAYERRGVLAGVAIASPRPWSRSPGLLALAGVVFWLWRRGERRAGAVVTTATTGVLVGLVYLPFLAGASHVLNGADHTVTPGSPWNLPARAARREGRGPGPAGPDRAQLDVVDDLFYLSLALTAVLVVGLAWRWARAPRPELAAGVATASYVVAAEYTLPWYAGWALPMFADRRISRIGWVVWAQAAVLLAAWRLPTHHTGGVFDTVLRGTFAYALPIVLLLASRCSPTGIRPTTRRRARPRPPTRPRSDEPRRARCSGRAARRRGARRPGWRPPPACDAASRGTAHREPARGSVRAATGRLTRAAPTRCRLWNHGAGSRETAWSYGKHRDINPA